MDCRLHARAAKKAKSSLVRLETCWNVKCKSIANKMITKHSQKLLSSVSDNNNNINNADEETAITDTYILTLHDLLSTVKFVFLSRNRFIVGDCDNYSLRIWCRISLKPMFMNMRTANTNYNKCPYLHLYLMDKNFAFKPKIYVDVQLNTIYNVLLTGAEVALAPDLILLILEFIVDTRNTNVDSLYFLKHTSKYCPQNRSNSSDSDCTNMDVPIASTNLKMKKKFVLKPPKSASVSEEMALDSFIGIDNNLIFDFMIASLKCVFMFDKKNMF